VLTYSGVKPGTGLVFVYNLEDNRYPQVALQPSGCKATSRGKDDFGTVGFWIFYITLCNTSKDLAAKRTDLKTGLLVIFGLELASFHSYFASYIILK
jgi:hypothetical protein